MQPPSVSSIHKRRFASCNRNRTSFDDVRPPSKVDLAFRRCTAGRFQERSLSSVMVGLVLSLHMKKVASLTILDPTATVYIISATLPLGPTGVIQLSDWKLVSPHLSPEPPTQFVSLSGNLKIGSDLG